MYRVALILSLWSLAVGASAQPALEQLERRLQAELGPADKPAAETIPAPPPLQGPAPATEQGYLGARLDDANDRGRGVRVLQTVPGGPAERAGLKANDLITDVDGLRIRELLELAPMLRQAKPEQIVVFQVLRGEARQKIDVRLSPAPPVQPEPPRARPSPPLNPAPPPPPDVVLPAKPPAALPAAELPPVPPPPEETRPLGADREAGRRLDELLRRIDALERRVSELEAAVRKKP
jgi:hypothetical protein